MELIMDSIVVGIDGSTGSARALDWAARDAARSRIGLKIVHAVDIPVPGSIYVNARMSSSTVAGLEKFSQDLLVAAGRRAAEVAPDAKIETQTQIGSPTSVLVDASQCAGKVVVGRRGLGGFGNVVGSVSLRVAARAYCPVFVIPDHGVDPIPKGPIVVGVDDSGFGIAALRFALQEALLRNSAVRAVTAYELPMVGKPLYPGVIADFEEYEHDQAVELLEKLLGEARTDETRDVKVEPAVVQGPTVEAILDHAGDAQLIVVGSHGRGPVRRLLLGSVSRLLLHETDRPVAVVDLPH
jgi:nucleotide-binding universal stress UspA family protein